jgi:hypothetical protein
MEYIEQFLTIIEFAVKMHIHPNTVRRFIKEGRVQALNMGIGKKKIYRIPISEIDRMGMFNLREMLKVIREEELGSKNDSDLPK